MYRAAAVYTTEMVAVVRFGVLFNYNNNNPAELNANLMRRD